MLIRPPLTGRTKFAKKSDLERLPTGPHGFPPRPGTDGPPPLVRNDSGGALQRFAVLGVTNVVFDPEISSDNADWFQSNFAFVGKTPDADRDGSGRFCIIQQPAGAGDIVPCRMFGLSVVHVNVPDTETYRAAGLITGDAAKMEAGEGGTPLVWHAPGPGTKLGVVNLSGGGGQGKGVIFEITDADYNDCTHVEAVVIASPCGGDPEIDEPLTIYDEAGCFFNVPEADLVPASGEAVIGFAMQYDVEVVDSSGYPTGVIECRWVVHNLCCIAPDTPL